MFFISLIKTRRVVQKCKFREYSLIWRKFRDISEVAKFSSKSCKHLCFREHFQICSFFKLVNFRERFFTSTVVIFVTTSQVIFSKLGTLKLKLNFLFCLCQLLSTFFRNHIIKYALLKLLAFPTCKNWFNELYRPVGSSARPFQPWPTSIREQTRTLNT